MLRVLEKTERRLGEKLFLKAIRCVGPKCATVRRGYPPGFHGKRKSRRKGGSEFGTLLREKQKVRFLYGLDDKKVARYSRIAASKQGLFSSNFVRLLESRLDNVVFRLGFVESRRVARQLVSHGHILVNRKKVTIPSYLVRVGDVVTIKESSVAGPLFAELEGRLGKYEPPRWLVMGSGKREGTVKNQPSEEESGINFDLTKIKEFYSR